MCVGVGKRGSGAPRARAPARVAARWGPRTGLTKRGGGRGRGRRGGGAAAARAQSTSVFVPVTGAGAPPALRPPPERAVQSVRQASPPGSAVCPASSRPAPPRLVAPPPPRPAPACTWGRRVPGRRPPARARARRSQFEGRRAARSACLLSAPLRSSRARPGAAAGRAARVAFMSRPAAPGACAVTHARPHLCLVLPAAGCRTRSPCPSSSPRPPRTTTRPPRPASLRGCTTAGTPSRCWRR